MKITNSKHWQGIKTRYRTTRSGKGRIVAEAECGSVVVDCEHGASEFEKHKRAAATLAGRWGWDEPEHTWTVGACPDGGYLWVRTIEEPTRDPVLPRLESEVRFWFSETRGHSYHTVKLTIAGETRYVSGLIQGGSGMAAQSTWDELNRCGFITDEEFKAGQDTPLWALKSRFDLHLAERYVTRKRELHHAKGDDR